MPFMGAFPRRAGAALITGLLAVAVLAGCGSSPPPAEPSLPEQAPDPATRCGITENAKKVVLTTEDGVKLAGALAGDGPHGVVLLPQRGADLCGWSPIIGQMVQRGLHVLAIDLRCAGYSACDNESDDQTDNTHDLGADAAAAIAELKRAGANKVVVMGASLGAATAVVAGGRFPDQVSGVVALSLFKTDFNVSGSADTDVTTPEKAAPRIRVPMLIVGSNADGGSIDGGTAKALIAQGAAAAQGKVIMNEGTAHGWDTLRTPDVATEVLSFLVANS